MTPKVQIVGPRTTFVECKLGSFCLGHVIGFLWRSNKAISIKTLWGCKIPCRCKKLISACFGSEKEVAKRGEEMGRMKGSWGWGRRLDLKAIWSQSEMEGRGFNCCKNEGQFPHSSTVFQWLWLQTDSKIFYPMTSFRVLGKGITTVMEYDGIPRFKGHTSETLLMTWGDA